MNHHRLIRNLFSLVAFLSFLPLWAEVTLPSVFGNHMVLQQNAQVKLWGWASPNEEITVLTQWDNVESKTKTNKYAQWELVIQTPKAGGPFSITIKGYNEITLKDILIGEVWLCSGQSNMEMSADWGIENGEDEVSKANYPNIRFFSVTNQTALSTQNDLKGTWQTCTPETMRYFSAVGYFFGKKLQENLEVPIGLVNSSWGGTFAESWMPQEPFDMDESLQKAANKLNPVEWGPHEPARIYNAMIAPITNFNFAGVIWYQGENNTANPEDYQHVFSTLIRSWRQAFNKELPFYFAQIAPYTYSGFSGVEVREAQRRTLRIENTGMVITSDIGDIKDIHPKDKKSVGLRFANIALKKHYKTIDDIVEGPLFSHVEFNDQKAVLSFDNTEGLYATTKTSLFQIAGNDKKYYEAKFIIKGNKIEIYSKKVKIPKYVRFAWDNTAESNIFNSVNLPMSSFTSE